LGIGGSSPSGKKEDSSASTATIIGIMVCVATALCFLPILNLFLSLATYSAILALGCPLLGFLTKLICQKFVFKQEEAPIQSSSKEDQQSFSISTPSSQDLSEIPNVQQSNNSNGAHINQTLISQPETPTAAVTPNMPPSKMLYQKTPSAIEKFLDDNNNLLFKSYDVGPDGNCCFYAIATNFDRQYCNNNNAQLLVRQQLCETTNKLIEIIKTKYPNEIGVEYENGIREILGDYLYDILTTNGYDSNNSNDINNTVSTLERHRDKVTEVSCAWGENIDMSLAAITYDAYVIITNGDIVGDSQGSNFTLINPKGNQISIDADSTFKQYLSKKKGNISEISKTRYSTVLDGIIKAYMCINSICGNSLKECGMMRKFDNRKEIISNLSKDLLKNKENPLFMESLLQIFLNNDFDQRGEPVSRIDCVGCLQFSQQYPSICKYIIDYITNGDLTETTFIDYFDKTFRDYSNHNDMNYIQSMRIRHEKEERNLFSVYIDLLKNIFFKDKIFEEIENWNFNFCELLAYHLRDKQNVICVNSNYSYYDCYNQLGSHWKMVAINKKKLDEARRGLPKDLLES
jgi:hypothetical protein